MSTLQQNQQIDYNSIQFNYLVAINYRLMVHIQSSLKVARYLNLLQVHNMNKDCNPITIHIFYHHAIIINFNNFNILKDFCIRIRNLKIKINKVQQLYKSFYFFMYSNYFHNFNCRHLHIIKQLRILLKSRYLNNQRLIKIK